MDELSRKDEEFIWHPFTPLIGEFKPLVIKDASGVFLNTTDGRKIIDAISSWWVNLHGHSHPHIAAAASVTITCVKTWHYGGNIGRRGENYIEPIIEEGVRIIRRFSSAWARKFDFDLVPFL